MFEIDENMDLIPIDEPQVTIDKRCKRKYGHTNWCRMGTLSDEETRLNPIAGVDDVKGIIYFRNKDFIEAKQWTL